MSRGQLQQAIRQKLDILQFEPTPTIVPVSVVDDFLFEDRFDTGVRTGWQSFNLAAIVGNFSVVGIRVPKARRGQRTVVESCWIDAPGAAIALQIRSAAADAFVAGLSGDLNLGSADGEFGLQMPATEVAVTSDAGAFGAVAPGTVSLINRRIDIPGVDFAPFAIAPGQEIYFLPTAVNNGLSVYFKVRWKPAPPAR